MSDPHINISQREFAKEQLEQEQKQSGEEARRQEADAAESNGAEPIREEKESMQGKETAQEAQAEQAQRPEQYVMVKFLHSSETQLCKNTLSDVLEGAEHVIVDSRYGKDIAKVLGEIKHTENYDLKEAQEIIRKANEEDERLYEENLAKEEEALKICREKVAKHKLDMKLVSAHYLVDEPKILFFFTADARVDFRELVKDLVSIFKMRIELRQIGVRDESRVLGGLAVCGRNYCCNGITDKLNPVSIKMAKEQNLSLNSMKISGPCGRLLCCLSYEYEFYKEEKGNLPQEGSFVQGEAEKFKVTDVNILVKRIQLQARDGRTLELPFEHFVREKATGSWKVLSSDLDQQ